VRPTARMRRVTPVLALVVLAAPAAVAADASASPARSATPAAEYPFRNPRLPLEVRVDDLVGRLTLDEKLPMLHQFQPAVPRLGVGPFKAGTEALHGVAWSNDIDNGWRVVTARGTVFPQAVGLASTWNPDLIRRVGSAVGDEARGYNAQNPAVWGLNLWAPVVNLLRDPRWGRNEEGYSEDATLTGAISVAYGKGLTGDDPRYLKTAPTLKHYIAYNNEVRRDVTSANVPPRVLNEYERQAFRPGIASGAATGVMTSYNLVNGRPTTVSPDLDDVLRRWTRRTLFNVSDAWAPLNLTGSQDYYETQAEANAAVLAAGNDSFTMNDSDHRPMVADLRIALAQGLVTEADVDDALRHSLSIRFRLGEFDPDGGPYDEIGPEVIDSPAHRALARRTAGEAMVLLKNSRGALPLDAARTGELAVVGPLADTLYSDWYGGSLPYRVTPRQGIAARLGSRGTVTGGEGVDRIALRNLATGQYVTATGTTSADAVTATGTTADEAAQFDVFDWGQGVVTLRNAANRKVLGYENGGFLTRDDQPGGWFVQQQFRLEAQADGSHVLRYAGYETRESWFGAGTYVTVGAGGRLALTPDAAQAARFTREVVRDGVADAVAAARDADAAVVVVGSMPFINGRENADRTTTALAERQEALVRAVRAVNPRTVVVLETSYPDTITWAQQNVPAILWTTHAGAETGNAVADVLFGDRNPAGRLTQTWYRSDAELPSILDYDIIKAGWTYMYHDGTPLYPFGHGLSYTSFRYSNLRVPAVAGAHGTVPVLVDVTNTGARAGDEVVQLYSHQRTSRVEQPKQQLRAFRRVHLAPGQTATVRLSFPASALAHWDVTRSRPVVETSAYDLTVGSSSADVRARDTVHVRGETIPARDLARTTRAENFDDYSGVLLVDESKPRGTAVGSTAGGQWVKFADARLPGRASTLTATVSRADAGNGTIQVRLGSPSGPLLGTATVPSTGDVYRYTATGAALRAVGGRHDVYLVLSSGVRVSSFTIR
jgi:beta-glucosidase